VAAVIQLALAALFVGVALLANEQLEDHLFSGSRALYVVLIVAVVAYAASYFARGFLAGHRWFGSYGGLMLLESFSRFFFALVVTLGLGSGQRTVAIGIAVAPLVSLTGLPIVLVRRRRSPKASAPTDTAVRPDAVDDPGFTLAHGVGFVAPVLLVMLSEQTFLNAGPIVVKATEGAGGSALAGFTFNVLLITRAPLQLFQAVQTSILPHLTSLRATGASEMFRRSVAVTIRWVAAFAGAVTIVMLAAGPTIMDLLFGGHVHYSRGGLAMVAVGMGCYLAAATLNQAALALGRPRDAAVCWVVGATAFVVFLVLPGFDDRVLQVEIGYLGAAALLCGLLYGLYRRALGVQARQESAEAPTTMS
jgi:O-antigen/teichoic acid export membrane protein